MTDSTAASVQRVLPDTQLMEIATGLHRSRALAVAADLEIADHLASGPLHVDDLATRTQTHASSLFRLMRALETLGVFAQVSPRVFANTSVSEYLRKDVPGSRWAIIRLTSSASLGVFDPWAALLGAIQSGRTAFDLTYDCNLWEFLKRNPELAAVFGEAMRSRAAAVTPAVTAAYEWGRFPTVADIGGGIGSQLVDILNAYQPCRGILFDQPETLARAIPHDRVERVAGSFFEQVPPRADAYILRSVIHDWPDAEAAKILKIVRACAKPDSRIILIEQIIQDAPEYASNKWEDLTMLLIAGGQERTANEYRQLLEEASLDIEEIVATASPFSLIVSRPRDSIERCEDSDLNFAALEKQRRE
jgi:hypothetical protein